MEKTWTHKRNSQTFNNGEQIAQLGTCVNKVIDYINKLEDRITELEKEVKKDKK